MVRVRREKVKVVKHSKGEFLDPESVNSTIRYSFETSLYNDGSSDFDGTISLSDCNRFISWSGDWDNSRTPLLAKVDNAIKILREARNSLVFHGMVADKFQDEHARKSKPKSRKKKLSKTTKRKAR